MTSTCPGSFLEGLRIFNNLTSFVLRSFRPFFHSGHFSQQFSLLQFAREQQAEPQKIRKVLARAKSFAPCVCKVLQLWVPRPRHLRVYYWKHNRTPMLEEPPMGAHLSQVWKSGCTISAMGQTLNDALGLAIAKACSDPTFVAAIGGRPRPQGADAAAPALAEWRAAPPPMPPMKRCEAG